MEINTQREEVTDYSITRRKFANAEVSLGRHGTAEQYVVRTVPTLA